ncbi:M23 family metallopeptidase [Methylocapsa sp. S129]|uniref:M23 family metallopeptidase n=1 Tax=Methylocapsa sp. S129 TaxID=1641869 RepID=UPI00131A9C43|nr:M23 family metallopeptidase [Methylocapsa sp. S129]
MAAPNAYPRPKLPTSHYFFSLARGESMRTFALRPALFWCIVSLTPILAVWSLSASLFIAFHDDMLGAIVAREAEMQYAYEDRLADARAQLDRVTSRQLLDQNSFEGKVHELLSRQAQLEQRTSIVASMAGQAGLGAETNASLAERARLKQAAANVKAPTTALMAIGAAHAQPAADSVLDSVKAFAPVEPGDRTPPASAKPRPLEEPRPERASALPADDREQTAFADLNDAANNPDVAAPTRLNLISHSLDRMEKRQLAALTQIGSSATETISRLSGVMEDAGIAVDRLPPPRAAGGVGGPYIPVKVDRDAPAFDQAVSGVERSLLLEDRLRRAVPFMPVRRPLIGEAEVSSPFGYRPDPFLGRPALHPGVDLVQAYGSTVKATGAGRVVHAGPMGGYGNMVEIDHGNGLATRYGHMSEVLVEEGQEVEAGATLGRLGSTGRSTGPHLHYEVRVDGEPVDPTRFLRAGVGLLAAE